VVFPRAFVATSEHQRFTEFCAACRQNHYIGLCYGPPGVGKTVSARRLSGADVFERLRSPLHPDPESLAALKGTRAILYTPEVVNGPRLVADQVLALWNRLLLIEAAELLGPAKRRQERETDAIRRIIGTQSRTVQDAKQKCAGVMAAREPKPFLYPLELLVVDEADRLKTASLEQLRDLFDRGRFGLVLIGMPGIEKRIARYPQLYSRVGFVHAYRALGSDEMRELLGQHAAELAEHLPVGSLAEPEIVAAILRITHGNFRLVVRLLNEVVRILAVNELPGVTLEAIDTARETLVIGTA
jgi:DNA transposition AAA+ family ATPase